MNDIDISSIPSLIDESSIYRSDTSWIDERLIDDNDLRSYTIKRYGDSNNTNSINGDDDDEDTYNTTSTNSDGNSDDTYNTTSTNGDGNSDDDTYNTTSTNGDGNNDINENNTNINDNEVIDSNTNNMDEIDNDNSDNGNESISQLDHESVTMKSIITKLKISYDIDSFIVSSSRIYSIIESMEDNLTARISLPVSRLSNAKSSRISVQLKYRFPQSRKAKKELSLARFPNILLGVFTANNFSLFLHMFWIDPPFVPKSNYFENKYIYAIVAALNYATIICHRNKECPIGDQWLDPECPLLSKFKSNTDWLGPGFADLNCFFPYNGNKTKTSTYMSKYGSMIFFHIFQTALSQMADNKWDGLEVINLLPISIVNQGITLDHLSKAAKGIANSCTYTLTASGMQNICCTSIFDWHSHPQLIQQSNDHNISLFTGYHNLGMKKLKDMLLRYLTNKELKKDVAIFYDIGQIVRHEEYDKSIVICLENSRKILSNILQNMSDFSIDSAPIDPSLTVDSNTNGLMNDVNENEPENEEFDPSNRFDDMHSISNNMDIDNNMDMVDDITDIDDNELSENDVNDVSDNDDSDEATCSTINDDISNNDATDDEYTINNDTQIIDDNESYQNDDNLFEKSEEAGIEDIEKFHRSVSNQEYGIFNIEGIGNWHSGVNKMDRIKDEVTNEVRLMINERFGTCGGQQYVPLSKVVQKKDTGKGKTPLNGLASILLSLIENYGQEELSPHIQKRIDLIIYHLSDVLQGIQNMQELQCTCRSEFFNQLNKETKEITFPLEVFDTIIRVYDKKSLAEFYDQSIKSSANPILKLFPTHFMKPTLETFLLSNKPFSPEVLTALMLHSEILTNELGSAHITGPIMKKLSDFFQSTGFIAAPNAFKNEPNSRMLSDEEKTDSGLLSGLCPSLLSITLNIPPSSYSDTSIEGIEFVNGILNFKGKFLTTSLAPRARDGVRSIIGRSKIPITTKQHIYFLKGITHKFLFILPEGK